MVAPKYRPKIIEFYTDSPEQKRKISEAAKAKGCTVSDYLSWLCEEDEHREDRPALGSDLQALRERTNRLESDLREAASRIANQEAELRKLRSEAFKQPSGEAQLDPDLLRVLQGGPIHDYKLLEAMGIDLRDSEGVQIVSRQLAILEASGLIKRSSQGWSWVR